MLDLKFIVKETAEVENVLKRRGDEDLLTELKEVVELDGRRRSLIQEVEALKHQRNEASQKIAVLRKNKEDDSGIRTQMKEVATQIKKLDERGAEIQSNLKERLLGFPNLLDPSVPDGKSSEQNVEVRSWGEKPTFSFTPKSHYELGEKLGLLDFKKAGEVTGARFVFLKGKAAKLNRAMVQFMLDTHGKNGYEEICPPFIVNRRTLTGTGQLPKFEEDAFKLDGLDYFLIPTAEVPVTNYHRDEILEQSQLPLKYAGYTPCFRAEAGSYGKDTKGIKRQHQFEKVEMVRFSHPSKSDEALEEMVQDAENLLQALKLPYRVMLLCGGDTGFSARKTYDIEVWSPFENNYVEISSCSNCGDFQARRAGIRFRDAQTRKPQFCHTLNGSGLPMGRTLLAIIENFQTDEGNFTVPDVLNPYLR